MTNCRFAALAAASILMGCSGSRSSSRPSQPLPRPPEPTQITLSAVRVTHAPWTAPPAAPLPRNRRALTADVAQPVLVTANDPVRACYKVLLAVNPQASGTITSLMRIGPDGVVSDIETTGPIDPALALILPCVLNAVHTRRFPATRSSALVSYPFVFSTTPGTAPVATSPGLGRPRPGELPVSNPEVLSVRPWTPSATPESNPAPEQTPGLVAEVLPDVTSLVDTCYAAALVMSPDMSGAFTLRLELEPSGAVTRLVVQDNNTLASPVRDCITTLGHRLQFHPAAVASVVSIPVTLAHDSGSGMAPGTSPGMAPLPLGAGISAPAP